MNILLLFICILAYEHTAFGAYVDSIPQSTKKPTYSTTLYDDSAHNIKDFFSHTANPFTHEYICTDPLKLQEAVRDAITFFDNYKPRKHPALSPKKISSHFISSDQAYETLQYIDAIIEQDKKHNGPYRISDPLFLKHNFNVVSWHGDRAARAKQADITTPADSILLTHYVMYHYPASYTRTTDHPYALYSLIDPKAPLLFTKQEVLNGILEQEPYKSQVQPLVWVSRDSLEQALLQGTIFFSMPDGETLAFNVDISNGLSFQKGITPEKQNVYWYFRSIKTKKHVDTLLQKSINRKNIMLAGNIYHLGVGKVIAISYKDPQSKKQHIQLGVLCDTGSAFKDNLYQLDLFGGIFTHKRFVQEHIQQYPSYVQAYLLYKSPNAVPVTRHNSY